MRDIDLQATEDFKFFATRVDTGAPADVASIAVSAYPDNSTTQITAGITTTQPFDSLTGFGNVRVVATVANGYAWNSTYALVITTGTVNSVSAVGAIVGEFTIGKNRPGLLFAGLAQATLSDTTHIQAGAAINFADDFLIGAIAVVKSGTGAGQSRVITDWDQSDDLATVDTMVAVDGTSYVEFYAGAPGSLTAPVPASLGTGAITNSTFAAGAVDATVVADGAIDEGAIASNAITDAKIATGAITAAKFAANAITSTVVADNTITAAKVATAALVSAKFSEADPPPANVVEVNDVVVTGTGAPGDEWGP